MFFYVFSPRENRSKTATKLVEPPCRRTSTFRRLHDVDAASGVAGHQKAIAQGDGREAEDGTVHHR